MSTPVPPVQPAQEQVQIKTYHCTHCTHLLLASTHALSALPNRRPPALDRAIILPLPPPHFDSSPASSSEDSDAERPAGEERLRSRRKQHRNEGADAFGYSMLLSTMVDRKPVMVRREDGFEKRKLLRCGRCRVVVGYKLDEAHFGDGEGAEAGKERRVVYLLSGGLTGTEDMVAGKKAGED